MRRLLLAYLSCLLLVDATAYAAATRLKKLSIYSAPVAPASPWDFTHGVRFSVKSGVGLVYVVYGGWDQRDATPGTVEADIAATIATLPASSKCLVLGVPTFDTATDYAGATSNVNVARINNNLRTTYGLYWQSAVTADGSGRLCLFADFREHFVEAYARTQAQDVTDYANDILPSSLRATTSTFSAGGGTSIDAWVAAIIAEKGW